eukprot:SM003874S14673  [mRNA]  locus=s3874:82:1305:+ [translate_table: standard]
MKVDMGEEKIYVTVRVRPLHAKEAAAGDGAVWECPSPHSLRFTEPLPERLPYPAVYHFDRVFAPECSSQEVYKEGAPRCCAVCPHWPQRLTARTKATIFAYGQTSSGKTYTMQAITEAAVLDIFSKIEETPHREYLLRVSALEIYNEVVRDLLSFDSGPLRLLDDPDVSGPFPC